MLTDQELTDRDEARRLAYACLIAYRMNDDPGYEMVGTLMNALSHHAGLFSPRYAEELGVNLMAGRDYSTDPLLIDAILRQVIAKL